MKRIYMTLALLGAIFTGAKAQTIDMEAALFMNEGTNINPAHFLSPDSTPTGDSVFGAWGVFNNGPDDILANDKFTVVTSFNRWVNQSDDDWSDTAKYYYLSIATAQGDKLAGSYALGPYSYDSLSKIGLLYDWNEWETNDSVVMYGPPYENFNPCQEYGMFVRVWGLGDNPQSPTNTDDDQTNNRKVVKVIWNCGTSGLPTIAPKEKIDISVYPNPAKDNISFDFTFSKNAHVETIVRDIAGRKVAGQDYGHVLAGTKKFNTDISKLAPGVYSIELSTGDFSGVSKFTIQK